MTTPWSPANAAEKTMLRAMFTDDRRLFFQIISTAALYLPTFSQDRQRGAGQRFMTWDLFGHTYLLVFTSVEALAAAARGVADGYTTTSYAELRRKWPVPQWRLAVNPGLLIDAWMEIDAVAQAAAGTRVVPAMADVLRARHERHDPADLEALDRYLGALLEGEVFIPLSEPVADPDTVPSAQLPWRVAAGYPRYTIEVFTELDEVPPDTPYLRASFTATVLGWPGAEYDLVIDPGSSLSFTLPGTRVKALLLWSAEAQDQAASQGWAQVARAPTGTDTPR
jgi:hypothetical protein